MTPRLRPRWRPCLWFPPSAGHLRLAAGVGKPHVKLSRRSLALGIGALAVAPRKLYAALSKPWHLPDGRFRNNYIGAFERSFSDLRKAFSGERPPLLSFPLAPNDPTRLRANTSETSLTWIGHCTLLLQVDGKNYLTDPHFAERASPVPFFGPKRTTPPGIELDELPRIDHVLISHNHYDHLDISTIRRLRKQFPDALYHVPLKLRGWFENVGIRRVVELDWWEARSEDGVNFTAVPTQHWSNRGLDRNETLWCGWVVETPNFRFLFIGDTGYSQDFKDIQEKFDTFDLAAIPIGAYNPRWFMKDAHQNPEEAVQCMQDLNAKTAVATHWGTFQLTFEKMDEPPQRLDAAMAAKGLDSDRFMVFKHGETRYL